MGTTTLRTRALAAAMMCAVLLPGCVAAVRPNGPTPKAVFIVVDGIPADVIEATSTPAIDAIAAEGGYTRAFVGGTVGGATESPTVSAVGYQSLLTGTWAHKHNVRDNAVEDPDYRYWDIFRIAKTHDPAMRTAIFSTWVDNRTKLLGDGLAAAGGNKVDHAVDGLELDLTRFPHDEHGAYIGRIDSEVVREAVRYLGDCGPDLSWIYLQYSDDVAHRFGDGPELATAVRHMDSYIGSVRAAVAARRERAGEDWLILVTTDHGRDSATGKDHGGQSDRERTIWIATNSQRLNDRFDDEPAIVDILPSIATHLGLTVPESVRRELDGHSFIDARR